MQLKLLLILLVATLALGQKTYSDGYGYVPHPEQFVRVDVYEDLLCDDCADFHKQFTEYLKTTTDDGEDITKYVYVVFHFFPLPFHHNSFFVSQLVPFAYDLNGRTEDVLDYAEYILSNQQNFASGAEGLSEFGVQQKICNETSNDLTSLDFTYSQCMIAFRNKEYIKDTVVQWKQGAHDGISQTPTVFVNALEIPAPKSVEEWKDLLNPVLPGSSESATGIQSKTQGPQRPSKFTPPPRRTTPKRIPHPQPPKPKVVPKAPAPTAPVTVVPEAPAAEEVPATTETETVAAPEIKETPFVEEAATEEAAPAAAEEAASTSEETANEEPATEEPAAEETSTEEASTEEASTEAPAAEETSAEEIATTEESTEEAGNEESAEEEESLFSRIANVIPKLLSGEEETTEEASGSEETTTEEAAPVAEETAATEEAPAVEEATKEEAAPATEEAPAAEITESAASTEAPAATETEAPAAAEAPAEKTEAEAPAAETKVEEPATTEAASGDASSAEIDALIEKINDLTKEGDAKDAAAESNDSLFFGLF